MPPVPRFRGIFTTPPTGFYEYEVEGERVQSTNRLDACTKVSDLRKKHGLPVVGDGMTYIMEYMCPRLPDGFCSQPSSVRSLAIEKVKAGTAQLFSMRVAASDVIERRLIICSACKMQTRSGFCVDCNGLLDWMFRGFSGKRGELPPDRALGVCVCDCVMAAAGATPLDRPLTDGETYPEGCWRIASGKDQHGQES
jgi:hypothetical protein